MSPAPVACAWCWETRPEPGAAIELGDTTVRLCDRCRQEHEARSPADRERMAQLLADYRTSGETP